MMKNSRVRPRAICAAVLLTVTLVAMAATAGRIVAIGDVHGDLADFNNILKQTGLIDDSRQWTGAGTVLVQLGDVVDRGPKSRECLDLLMEVQRQAQRKNGQIIALLGNHEVMAMNGDMRYVAPEDYQSFVTAQSVKVRDDAYRAYLDFLSSHGDHASDVTPADQVVRDKWMTDHPLGFFERRDAFGPQGVYGRWLRGHDVAVQIGDVVFVHGGLNPTFSFRDVRELNQRAHAELADFDSIWQLLSEQRVIWKYMTIQEAVLQIENEPGSVRARVQADPKLQEAVQKLLGYPTWTVNSQDGPLWYRGLAQDPEEDLKAGVDAMLARLKIGYIVAAHTPTSNSRINARFGNRVFLIDTGMLNPVFGGRASALEIKDSRFTAYYSNEKPLELPAPTSAPANSASSSKDSGREPTGPR